MPVFKDSKLNNNSNCILVLWFTIKECGRHFRGDGEGGQVGRSAAGGVHTNSLAMIMFLCVCESSLHASSSL